MNTGGRTPTDSSYQKTEIPWGDKRASTGVRTPPRTNTRGKKVSPPSATDSKYQKTEIPGGGTGGRTPPHINTRGKKVSPPSATDSRYLWSGANTGGLRLGLRVIGLRVKGSLCAQVIWLRVAYNQNDDTLSRNSLRYLSKANRVNPRVNPEESCTALGNRLEVLEDWET